METRSDGYQRVISKDYKQLTIRIPPEVHQAVKVHAAKQGRSMAAVVEDLIIEDLVHESQGGNE
jgi:predicted HicB family RNase H-like nuclease